MSITFETAALADVMGRAARVAPTKGHAHDRAGGILLTYDPSALTEPVSIKATDLDVSFYEAMQPDECTETSALTWRIPAALIAGITANLPLGTQTRLEIKDDDPDTLLIKCGKSKAKIKLYRDIAVNFDPFDPAGLVEVPGFAQRVQQIAWACDKTSIPFTGVHIDGEQLIATDRYRLAVVPLKVPITEPITVPLDVLNAVARGVTDAKIAAVGKRLHVMPTERTQVTAVIYDTKYPDVTKVLWRPGQVDGAGAPHYDQSFTVDAELLVGAIQRMLVLVRGERYPYMRLAIGQGRVHIRIDVPDVGEMEDEVAVVGADHDDFNVLFTPLNFVDGLSHCNKKEVKVSYLTTNPHRNVLFEDGDGYECWIVPLHERRLTAGDS